jgi:hypothetical protein
VPLTSSALVVHMPYVQHKHVPVTDNPYVHRHLLLLLLTGPSSRHTRSRNVASAADAAWVLLCRSFTAGSLPRSLTQRGPALYQGHSSRQSTQDEHQDD